MNADAEDAMRRLSIVDNTDEGWSRRQLLLTALATGAAAGLSGDLLARTSPAEAAARGNLLLVQLAGGNDAFNMIPPVTGPLAAQYRNARGAIAIQDAIPARIGHTRPSGLGFHPAMPYLASRYRAGKVAVVRGVGYPNHSRSHFDAIAMWMAATPTPGPSGAGWIGRWLDTLALPGLVDAVQIGSSVPPHMVGHTRKAASLDVWEPGFGTNDDFSAQHMYGALSGLSNTPHARGVLADRVSHATSSMISLNRAVQPLYHKPKDLSGDDIERRLELAARLFNSGLGIRVISTIQGDYDNHSGELANHADALGALDRGFKKFFAALSPTMAQRTIVMTFSEFGRKVHVNDSDGTDHGTAAHLLVLGSRVRGGMYGAHPPFAQLGDWDDPTPTTDFRSVYASILRGWLRADHQAVLGKSYPLLKLFRSGPG